MYAVEAFREERIEVLHALIASFPLATLVLQTPRGLEANHIPMLVDPHPAPFGTLLGHVARANPLWRNVDDSTEILAVFQGSQGYITPSWYPSKKENGKVVPTWNYAVVHAHGPVLVHHDAQWLRALVTRLTDQNEAKRELPWQVKDAPADYIDTMLKAIVGIEVPIRRLQGKWKMSQNRLPDDRAGVIQGLEARNTALDNAMLDAMRK